MKTKITNIDKCARLFEIEMPPEVVNEAFCEVYKKIKRTVKIPGFRIGAAPQDLLEKYHGKDAEEEALKCLITEGCRKTLNDHNINPVTLPEIMDIEFGRNKKLSFKAKIEIRPDIKFKKYKGIKVMKKKITVCSDEVSKALKRLQEINAEFVPLVENRSVLSGDYTICDIEAAVDGKPISKRHENLWVRADKDASMLGLGEKLIGLNCGDTKEIDVKLPDNYPDNKYSGKNARFKMVLKEIKIKKLHDIDDEFAKDLGKENLKTLEAEIRGQLVKRKEDEALIEIKNQILDELLKEYKFGVPPSVVRRQFEALLKQAEDELLSRGLHKDQVTEKKKELEPKLKIDAETKIKVYFLLDEISRLEHIELTDEDVNKALEDIGRLSNQSKDTVKEYYERNDLIDGLKEQLREEKTLDWLVSAALVEEEK